MKIHLRKIGVIPVSINRYIHDELFSFRLALPPDYHSARLEDFKLQLSRPDHNVRTFLSQGILGSRLPKDTTVEDMMNMNFNHVYGASEYFTNGQKIATLIKTDIGYEVAFHHDMRIFESYFWSSPTFGQFSISNFRTDTYEVYEKAITGIVKFLSAIEVIKIPVSNGKNGDYMEIRKVHPLGYIFKLDGKEIYKDLQDARYLDKITQEIIEWGQPHALTCCFRCINFQFSGMSHDMSGGASGYCRYIKDRVIDLQGNQSTTHIWSLCEVFTEKTIAKFQ